MKIIILTGFTSGLGRALYGQLKDTVSHNSQLICIGRHLSRITLDTSATYIDMEMSRLQEWKKVTEFINRKATEITLISNASTIEPIAKVGALDNSLIQDAANINYVNPMLLVNELVAYCNNAKVKLNVVNVSSGAASRVIGGWSLYCSTKAAFRMFLDVMAEDNVSNVKVVHIDPGVINTKMQSTIRSKSSDEMIDVESFTELKALNKLKSPQDAATELLTKVGITQ